MNGSSSVFSNKITNVPLTNFADENCEISDYIDIKKRSDKSDAKLSKCSELKTFHNICSDKDDKSLHNKDLNPNYKTLEKQNLTANKIEPLSLLPTLAPNPQIKNTNIFTHNESLIPTSTLNDPMTEVASETNCSTSGTVEEKKLNLDMEDQLESVNSSLILKNKIDSSQNTTNQLKIPTNSFPTLPINFLENEVMKSITSPNKDSNLNICIGDRLETINSDLSIEDSQSLVASTLNDHLYTVNSIQTFKSDLDIEPTQHFQNGDSIDKLLAFEDDLVGSNNVEKLSKSKELKEKNFQDDQNVSESKENLDSQTSVAVDKEKSDLGLSKPNVDNKNLSKTSETLVPNVDLIKDSSLNTAATNGDDDKVTQNKNIFQEALNQLGSCEVVSQETLSIIQSANKNIKLEPLINETINIFPNSGKLLNSKHNETIHHTSEQNSKVEDIPQTQTIEETLEENITTREKNSSQHSIQVEKEDDDKAIEPQVLDSHIKNEIKTDENCKETNLENTQVIKVMPLEKKMLNIDIKEVIQTQTSTTCLPLSKNCISEMSDSSIKVEFGLKHCHVDLRNSRISKCMLKSIEDPLATKPNFNKLKRKLEDMLQCAEKEEEKALCQIKKMRMEKSRVLQNILQEIQKIKKKFKV